MSVLLAQGKTARVAAAIEERLRRVFPAAVFHHAILPAKLSPAVWNDLVRGTPFVGIGWSGNEASGTVPREWQGRISFQISLVTQNERGIRERYFGDRFAPGIFAMADAATVALNGATVAGIGTLFVPRVADAFVDGWGDNMAIAVVHVVVTTPITVRETLDGPEICADDLREVVWNWIVGPDLDVQTIMIDQTEKIA